MATSPFSSGRSPFGSGGLDLNNPDSIEAFARQRGIKVPEESKPFSALRAVGRVLGFTNAVVAGAARGVINPEKSVVQGVQEGVRDNISFSDVIREDIGINPQDRAGKVAVGAAGLAADILFDPLTYISFGMGSGVKLATSEGTKVLGKGGTKAITKASSEIIESRVKRLVGEGMEESAARLAVANLPTRIAGKAPKVTDAVFGSTVDDLVEELASRTINKELTSEAAEKFISEGLSQETIFSLSQLGPRLLDKGGIKFFGNTLVSSARLAQTPVGRAARNLGETNLVKAIKEPLGKTFVADYKKDPVWVALRERGSASTRFLAKQQADRLEKIFSVGGGLSDEEATLFFNTIYNKKQLVNVYEDEIVKATTKEFNDRFVPGAAKKLSSREGALRRLEGLEDLAERKTKTIQESIAKLSDDLTNPKIDALEESLKNVRAEIRSLKPEKVVDGADDDILKIADNEVASALNDVLGMKESGLKQKIIDALDELEKLKTSGVDATEGATEAARRTGQRLSKGEKIALLRREMVGIQNEVTERATMLQKILDARKLAKARLRTEKLTLEDFGGNQKLLDIANELFEGPDAFVKQLSQIAGLPEDVTIKFYLPSIFEDKVVAKNFAAGRNMSSPNMGFLKRFSGVRNEDLITDPLRAYKAGATQVVASRIRTETIDTAMNVLGRPLAELTESEAKDLGLTKFTRKTLDGVKEAWVPKELADDFNRFLNPGGEGLRAIDDLARGVGFDGVTSLFKTYVTGLFPGFHMRNITANEVNLALAFGVDAANPRFQKMALDLALGRNLDEVFTTKTGRSITLGQLQEQVFRSTNFIQEGDYGDVALFIDDITGIGKSANRFSRFNPLSTQNVAAQAGRKFGQTTEQQAKWVGIISSLARGNTLEEAIKDSEKVLFNYAKLTPIERTIFRRLIPFYTFARKNAELQVKMMAQTPGKVAGELKAIRGLGEMIGEPVTNDDIEGLPDYVLNSLGIKAGAWGNNEFGQETFLVGLGLPIEEFLQRFSGESGFVWNSVRSTLASLNPIIKLPLEKATGQDFFRNRPIADISNAEDLKSMFDIMPPTVAEQMKEAINFVEIPNQPVYADGKVVGRVTKYRANPFALHLLRNLPTSRIQATSGFLSDEEESTFSKAARFFTGVRGFSIDQEQQKFFKDLERKRELEDWLIRMGVLKKYESVYAAN